MRADAKRPHVFSDVGNPAVFGDVKYPVLPIRKAAMQFDVILAARTNDLELRSLKLQAVNRKELPSQPDECPE
jgi:hypothetical protein